LDRLRWLRNVATHQQRSVYPSPSSGRTEWRLDLIWDLNPSALSLSKHALLKDNSMPDVEPHEQFIDVAGAKIHVRKAGQGKRLGMLHSVERILGWRASHGRVR